MKKSLPALAIVLLAFLNVHSQTLLNKVPFNASMVIKYSGENFSKNIPLKKVESYPFIRKNLFRMLNMDSLTTLENSGIDLQQDVYQYVITEDSTINFVNLVHLKNVAQFLKLVDAQSVAELKPEKKNGYEWVTVDAGTYFGWNNEWAMIVISHYENPNRYNYHYDDYDYSTDSTVTVDTAYMAPAFEFPPPVPPPPPPVLKKAHINKAPVNKSKAAKPKNLQKKNDPVAKKQQPPVKVEEIVPDEMDTAIINKAYDEEITATNSDYWPGMNHGDSVHEAKRDSMRLEQEKITAARQKKVSASIIEKSFAGQITSIESEASYKKIIDPSAHISAWFNYQDLLRQYLPFIYRSRMAYSGVGSPRVYYDYGSNIDSAPVRNVDPPLMDKIENTGFKTAMNVYFEKDKMRVEQKSYTAGGDMADFGKDLFNSKQSTDLVKLVNPDNIAYFSASINTEAMSKYYYKSLKQYLSNISYIGEYREIVDVYIDLMEIVIDEKAISDLLPGNYMLVLHDMKTKVVSYTDYVYDDNFKSTELKKSKQELSPNFTFAMETRNEAFMKKVAALPLKYARKGNYNYQDRGGYYELIFDSGKNVLASLYFLVKDGKVIITTSKQSIDIAMNNTGNYSLDDETKKSILKNNYSFQMNTKRLIQQLGPEVNSGVNKQISNYLMENIGDVKMESSLKDNMIQGTTTMAISGDHTNSLEFFFNVIDKINDIIKKDREEAEQKLN